LLKLFGKGFNFLKIDFINSIDRVFKNSRFEHFLTLTSLTSIKLDLDIANLNPETLRQIKKRISQGKCFIYEKTLKKLWKI